MAIQRDMHLQSLDLEHCLRIWKLIEICVDLDVIIIMQAANTGLTGGSTPYGNDYIDRPVIIINTRRINDIHIIDNGKQILGFAGSTLIGLEKSYYHMVGNLTL